MFICDTRYRVLYLYWETEKGSGTDEYQPKPHSLGNLEYLVRNICTIISNAVCQFICLLQWVISDKIEPTNESNERHKVLWRAMLLTCCTQPDICHSDI